MLKRRSVVRRLDGELDTDHIIEQQIASQDQNANELPLSCGITSHAVSLSSTASHEASDQNENFVNQGNESLDQNDVELVIIRDHDEVAWEPQQEPCTLKTLIMMQDADDAETIPLHQQMLNRTRKQSIKWDQLNSYII
eukprot:8592006-Pyramimonas_sp.AAC.2